MWEAVEREPGVYDWKYLDQIETLINKLGAAKIYVLVDAHQDIFARFMCGEGIPDFYAKPVITAFPSCLNQFADPILRDFYKDTIGDVCNDMRNLGYTVDPNGDYILGDCLKQNFGNYYNSTQSGQAYEALWSNIQSLNDKFIAFWDAVTYRFRDNPYVVGFDPLNEPYPGNIVQDPTLNTPGVAD